jgi:8-oxo-dGTP pyrophosphatase MutT (NUDIX family)
MSRQLLETTDAVAPVCPAATVVLVRESAEGPEALLVQRSSAVSHMGGMWVFPGGKVDSADYPEDGDPFRAALNAAIRETREEAGLEIREDQLVHFSHWTTPEGAKRRFATWFFLGILEEGQEVQVDGGEIAHHRWVRPEVAFAEIADVNNPFRLMPPTFVSLVDLAAHPDCVAARVALGKREALVFEPRMVFVEDGICFLYAGDAGYESCDLSAPGSRHRTYMVSDQLEYVRDVGDD